MSDRSFRDGPARYATGQLERALAAVVRGVDAADRKRAQAKVRRWRDVLAGMASGALTVGERTPVAGVPAWVTLEVAHGGFATGRASAEMPLSENESALVAALPDAVPGRTDRERLNLWYLGDAGQAELLEVLRSGHYRIEVPEDAALPVVALLLDQGFGEQALDLVAELRPFMSRLRFVPPFDPAARPSGTAVRVASVGEAVTSLRAVRTPDQLAAMRNTIDVWNPLYDRLVALWCRTVDGELPYLDDAGVVQGAWPCRIWPDNWSAERARWLADFAATQRDHALTGQHAHRKSNFARLHDALLACPDDSAALTPRQVGWIRRGLANTITRHGAPGTPTRVSARAQQAESIAAPPYSSLAAILVDRMKDFPSDGGIPDLAPIIAPVSEGDASGIASGTAIPAHLLAKAARALEASADELIHRGIISSGDVLAGVLPQLTSRLLAADITDPVAAALYEQLYTAFRRRRGLLLLNLQHQVRFEELPWVTATAPLRDSAGETAGRNSARAAYRLLQQMTMLALTSFPYAMLPNPLVREFRTLATRAELKLPLVEEVAADIFMGTFTQKWLDAALITSGTMEGTLYQAYYGLPSLDAWVTHSDKADRWGAATAEGFTRLCTQRAGEAGSGGSYVAQNGTVLEQSQILTTHNLAVLVDALGLDAQLRDAAPDLARRTFTWVVRRLSRPASDWHAGLIQVKGAAYAWRQGIYLLSFCDKAVQQEQVLRLLEQAESTRLSPAVYGLAHIVEGGRFTSDGEVPHGPGRRFLGWSAGQHWYFG